MISLLPQIPSSFSVYFKAFVLAGCHFTYRQGPSVKCMMVDSRDLIHVDNKAVASWNSNATGDVDVPQRSDGQFW